MAFLVFIAEAAVQNQGVHSLPGQESFGVRLSLAPEVFHIFDQRLLAQADFDADGGSLYHLVAGAGILIVNLATLIFVIIIMSSINF